MKAPLFTALNDLADRDPLRLHMPGHKGRMTGPFREIARLDFTELDPTGNLYTGQGPIAEAERRFASLAGARDALFFTCGSTQGIFTMLAAAVGMDGTLLLDRGCHKSVYHGMALLDITPVYYCPPPLLGTALSGVMDPAALDLLLTQHPKVQAVMVTSPSYYGVITPIAPLSEVCRKHGVFLLVDQAHGAHFPFVGLPTAVQEGADLAVVSAHKTLPALGSSSILYVGGGAPWDALRLKELSGIFATTSPSYPIMASMDYARAQLEGALGDEYQRAAEMTQALRDRINLETPFRALTERADLLLDPCRLTIDAGAGGLTGDEADRLLRQSDIYVEMWDQRYLVAILTCCDGKADLDRLLAALKTLPANPPAAVPELPLPPLPDRRCSLRTALFGPGETLPLYAAAGRTAAQIIAPYPPGIPIIAPGEEITEKHIAYLQKTRYNIEGSVRVTLNPR